jgi:hypothetical protein
MAVFTGLPLDDFAHDGVWNRASRVVDLDPRYPAGEDIARQSISSVWGASVIRSYPCMQEFATKRCLRLFAVAQSEPHANTFGDGVL